MTRTNHLIIAGAVAFALKLPPLQAGVLLFGGVIPDLDLVMWGPAAHRTITHWWPLWAALMAWSFRGGQDIIGPLTAALAGGAFVHLACDWLTIAGIPLGPNPFGLKRGWRLVATGTLKETGLALAIAASIFMVGLLMGGYSSLLGNLNEYLPSITRLLPSL